MAPVVAASNFEFIKSEVASSGEGGVMGDEYAQVQEHIQHTEKIVEKNVEKNSFPKQQIKTEEGAEYQAGSIVKEQAAEVSAEEEANPREGELDASSLLLYGVAQAETLRAAATAPKHSLPLNHTVPSNAITNKRKVEEDDDDEAEQPSFKRRTTSTFLDREHTDVTDPPTALANDPEQAAQDEEQPDTDLAVAVEEDPRAIVRGGTPEAEECARSHVNVFACTPAAETRLVAKKIFHRASLQLGGLIRGRKDAIAAAAACIVYASRLTGGRVSYKDVVKVSSAKQGHIQQFHEIFQLRLDVSLPAGSAPPRKVLIELFASEVVPKTHVERVVSAAFELDKATLTVGAAGGRNLHAVAGAVILVAASVYNLKLKKTRIASAAGISPGCLRSVGDRIHESKDAVVAALSPQSALAQDLQLGRADLTKWSE